MKAYKAYMSVPGVRAVCCVSPIRDSQHAEAEARGIIRDTEPSVLAWDGPYHRELVQVGQHAQLDPLRQSHQALAEALAAFVDGAEVRS